MAAEITTTLADALASVRTLGIVPAGDPTLDGAGIWRYADGARVAWVDSDSGAHLTGTVAARCWHLVLGMAWYVLQVDGDTRYPYHLQTETALREVA